MPLHLPIPCSRVMVNTIAGPINWQANAFLMDKEEIAYSTIKPFQELLAIAYLRSIRARVHTIGLSYFASYSGGHRSGKSLFAALTADLWDRSFWPRFEQRIVQSPQEFVKAMEVIIQDEIKGAAIVIDEAGATMAASDWYERWLKLIQKSMQICGLLKPMILFVAPNRDFIVSGMRKLIVGEYYMERGSPEYTFCTPYQVKYSTIKHDYYYRKPIVRINNMTVQLKRIKIFKPPQFFIDRYINITEPRKMDMMAKFGEEVTQLSDDSNSNIDYEQIVDMVFHNKELYFGPKTREGIPTIDQTTLEIQHKLKPKMAKWVKGKVELRLAEALKEVAEIEELQQTKAGRQEMEQNIARDLIRKKAMKRAPVEADVLDQIDREREKEALEQADEELKSVLSEV